MHRFVARSLALVAALAWAAAGSGCRPKPDEPLGPPDSFTLLARLPSGPGGAAQPPTVARVPAAEGESQPIERLFVDGFAAEMLRTVYLLKQVVRELHPVKGQFPPAARAWAGDTTYLVLGADGDLGRGLALTGSWFGGPVQRPDALWVGLPARPSEDRALVQTVAGRLASLTARVVASGGRMDALAATGGPLVEGYRLAMEVIAREWRSGRGSAGVVPPSAGTADQRETFARVRENRFVLGADGTTPRPAADLLGDAGVTATVLYRMAQAKALAQKVAANEFYAPVADNRLPPGVSPAAALGPFRNFQIKLLVAWIKAVLAGTPPRTIAELVEVYGREHPGDRAEAYRIFVVTTFGATIKPGGVVVPAAKAEAALAELTALSDEAVAGKRSLTAASREEPAK